MTLRLRAVLRHLRSEDGGGGILGVAVVVALAAAFCATVPFGSALAARERLHGAADAAALAAADVASGRVAGVPCEAAAALAAQVGAGLEFCELDAAGVATITLGAEVLGIPLTATARAGPPPRLPADGGPP